MKLTIDGKIIETEGGKTILDVCKKEGIEIPTLCFLEGFEPYTGCFLCVVEVEGIERLVPSCATYVSDGMVVWTNTERVIKARRLCLELLLSNHWGDCQPPCRMKCPAQVDIEGYIRSIKEGDYERSYNLIMEDLPFPSTIGRICPAKCEEDCRRALLEGPVAIRNLKRFVGDWALKAGLKHKAQSLNGKKVAIIGGGPAGISCAYYLRKEGFFVKIFEKEDKLGGMLRYGIPTYRLPKDILDKEIARILELGIEVKTNSMIKAPDLIALKRDFDAVFIAIGAQVGIKMGIVGEEMAISGIKLLKDIANGTPPNLGKSVCVIGGGNTAIDCARSVLRLGVNNVSILYRRGRDEMPASNREIEEAIEEGVRIEFLVAPNKILPDGIECIRMALKGLDSSGRPRPIPIPNSEFKIKVDKVIGAIGQRVDIPDGIKKNNGLVLVDEEFHIEDNLFAGGDCVLGPSTAVEAIAQGKKAAFSIMNYLNKKPKTQNKAYNCVKWGITKKDLKGEKTQERCKADILSPNERKKDFKEVEKTLNSLSSKNEAERCLRCGCEKVADCLLKRYAGIYNIQQRFNVIEKRPIDTSRADIKFDPNKCILCAKCIRLCSEVKKLGVLGFVGRGYNTEIKPELGKMLSETSCDGCLECVKVCPTGAFVKR